MKKLLIRIMFFMMAAGITEPAMGMEAPLDIRSKLTLLQASLTKICTSLTLLQTQLGELKNKLSGKPATGALGKEVYITLVHGDITNQKFENQAQAAIVNAANSAMRGGGGIDGAIHTAAGPSLLAEEKRRNLSCPVGQALLTGGHNLAPLRIIHTVGPKGGDSDKKERLTDAYTNCLKLADQNKITAIGFNCISTAIFGYNINEATPVALTAVFKYLKDHPESKVKEVRFVVFLLKDYPVYKTELGKYVTNGVITLGPVNQFLTDSTMAGGNPPLCFKFTRP